MTLLIMDDIYLTLIRGRRFGQAAANNGVRPGHQFTLARLVEQEFVQLVNRKVNIRITMGKLAEILAGRMALCEMTLNVIFPVDF